MKKLIPLIAILQLFACSNDPFKKSDAAAANPTQTFPEQPVKKYKDNGDDTGDGDFALSIVAISETDSTTIYKALSSWGIKNLGLLVEIPKKQGDMGMGRNLKLKSIGAESDNLIRFIAQEYDQPLDTTCHFNDLSLDYVNMAEFAKTLGTYKNDTSLDYKLFFQDTISEDHYAELYVNINKMTNQVEFHEKDPEYRPKIIGFLNSPAPKTVNP